MMDRDRDILQFTPKVADFLWSDVVGETMGFNKVSPNHVVTLPAFKLLDEDIVGLENAEKVLFGDSLTQDATPAFGS